LIVSFTNEEIFRDGIFIVQAIALYLIDTALIEKPETEDSPKVKKALPEAG